MKKIKKLPRPRLPKKLTGLRLPRKLRKPKLLIPAALGLVLVVVVVVVVVAGGGGGSDLDSGRGGKADKNPRSLRPRFNPKQAPIVTTGVVDEARRVGVSAVAQARGTIRTPSRVRVRVSAAPKQTVSINWQLSCFLPNRKTKVGKGEYRTRSPDVREIKVPVLGAKTCIATTSAQLTRVSKGRIKVTVIAG